MIHGCFTYKEFMMSQHHDVTIPFRTLVENNKPKRIMEIGTYTGGFIVAIRDIIVELNLSTHIKTYDISEKEIYDKIRKLGINVCIKNIFNSNYTDLNEDCKSDVISYIQDQGMTLVLCDGGNKIKEFNLLAQYLKPGDIIMAHDYSYSKDYFNQHINNKIWNWCEITHEDIKESCNLHSLVDYMQDDFQKVVWVCKRKSA